MAAAGSAPGLPRMWTHWEGLDVLRLSRWLKKETTDLQKTKKNSFSHEMKNVFILCEQAVQMTSLRHVSFQMTKSAPCLEFLHSSVGVPRRLCLRSEAHECTRASSTMASIRHFESNGRRPINYLATDPPPKKRCSSNMEKREPGSDRWPWLREFFVDVS